MDVCEDTAPRDQAHEVGDDKRTAGLVTMARSKALLSRRDEALRFLSPGGDRVNQLTIVAR
jgi:hypothetical protein